MARSYKMGAISPVEVAGEAIKRAAASSGVFTVLTERSALLAAHQSAKRWSENAEVGPLDGVPVAVKDCFDVRGEVTTFGSLLPTVVRRARSDAALVRMLRQAGAVIVGKTTLSELAFSGLGLNPNLGTPRNPTGQAEELVPGGSSSGSAVAVAQRIVPLALGTDTSGSVRVPAAFSGVSGYKATSGAFPTGGMRPLSPSLDSIGFLAASVADLLLLESALRQGRSHRPRLSEARLVVPDDEVIWDCDHLIAAAFQDVVRKIAQHRGFTIELRPLPALAEAQAMMDEFGTVVAAEAAALYGDVVLGLEGHLVDSNVVRRLQNAQAVRRTVRPLYRHLNRLRSAVAQQLGDAYLMCPTVRQAPPSLSRVLTSDQAYDRANARTLRSAMLLSYLGMPGVSQPISHRGDGGCGLLISASEGRDEPVLEVAALIEGVLTCTR